MYNISIKPKHMIATQKLNSSSNLYKSIVKIILLILATIVAFIVFIQFSPTIAHAAPNDPTPNPRTPNTTGADSTTLTNNNLVTNTGGNSGKPVDVCGVISTCPRFIDTYKTTSNTPDSLAKSIVKLILTFVYFAIYISSAIAVVFIVVAGYKYITSQGDEKNTKPALDTLKNAVIGLALTILSLTIVTLISNFLTNFNF
jgi:Type IV secretion system pilin